VPAHMHDVLDERKIAHVSGVILYAITHAENAFLFYHDLSSLLSLSLRFLISHMQIFKMNGK